MNREPTVPKAMHSLAMTMRYSHLAPAHEAAAVAKLAAALRTVLAVATPAVGGQWGPPRADGRVLSPSNCAQFGTFPARFLWGQPPPSKSIYKFVDLGKWRRGELNPRPKVIHRKSLHA